MIEDKLYTPQEVKAILRCGITFVYDHKKELGAIQIGGLIRFPGNKLRQMIDVNLEVGQEVVLQVQMEGPSNQRRDRVSYTGSRKTRSSRKTGRAVEATSDEFGLYRLVRESYGRKS